MARRKTSDVVRVAEIDLAKALLTHPIFAFVTGFTVLELLQEAGVGGRFETTAAEVALAGISYGMALSALIGPVSQAALQLAPLVVPGTLPGVPGIPGLP